VINWIIIVYNYTYSTKQTSLIIKQKLIISYSTAAIHYVQIKHIHGFCLPPIFYGRHKLGLLEKPLVLLKQNFLYKLDGVVVPLVHCCFKTTKKKAIGLGLLVEEKNKKENVLKSRDFSLK